MQKNLNVAFTEWLDERAKTSSGGLRIREYFIIMELDLSPLVIKASNSVVRANRK